jgi:hypothetical protein
VRERAKVKARVRVKEKGREKVKARVRVKEKAKVRGSFLMWRRARPRRSWLVRQCH